MKINKKLILDKMEQIQINAEKISHKNNSMYYYSFLFVVMVLLIFFLTSRLFLPDDTALKNSEIGKTYDINSATNITLEEWTYSNQNKMMFINLTLNNQFLTYDYELIFEAVSRQDPFKKLDLKVVYNDKTNYFIAIENVPENYKAISIKVMQKSKINNSTSEIKLYQDYRKMKVDNNEQIKTTNEYAIISVTNEIEKNKQKQNELSTENEILKQQILNIDNIILELQTEKKYQTIDEMKKTDDLIISKESEKISTQKKIDENTNSFLSVGEKLDKLSEKLSEFEQNQTS